MSLLRALRWLGFRLLKRKSQLRLKMSQELMLVKHSLERMSALLYLDWQRMIMKEAKIWQMVLRSLLSATTRLGELVKMSMRSSCWLSVSYSSCLSGRDCSHLR